MRDVTKDGELSVDQDFALPTAETEKTSSSRVMALGYSV
jgi:hypothetical protein